MYRRFEKRKVKKVEESKEFLKLFKKINCLSNNSVLTIHFFNLFFRKKSVCNIKLQINCKRSFTMEAVQ